MLLENILPNLPNGYLLAFDIVAILSGVLLVYAVFVEQEHRRDLMRVLGAFGLGSYALYMGATLVAYAMFAVSIASAVEFIEIMLGLHKHGPEDLKKYKKMWRVGRKK